MLEFEDGECTCPVGYNCKHVAAIVIAADRRARCAATRRGSALGGAGRRARSRRRGSRRCARSIEAAPAAQAVGNPLAIELALRAERPAPGAAARRG